MYGEFFGIDESAFSIAPNPKYLFLSTQHQEVLAHLLYGITRSGGGFVLITGEIGTGKTTVCRSLFAEIPDNTDIALIVNPKLEPVDLLASICDELNITYPDVPLGAKTYLKKLSEKLIESHAQGRNTILIIDEAQNLSVDALETIRGLTNLETDEQKLLQIILIGQPELRDRLNTHAMEQLNQRITARFHLQALNKKEVASYIKHRLTIGNANANIFSKSNIDSIYKLTGGVPRLVNVLCDRALLGSFVQKEKKVTNEIIHKAAAESLGKDRNIEKSPEYFSSSAFAWAAVLVLVVITLAIIFYDRSKVEIPFGVAQNKQSTEIYSDPNNKSSINVPEVNQSIDGNLAEKNSSQIIPEEEMPTQIVSIQEQAVEDETPQQRKMESEVVAISSVEIHEEDEEIITNLPDDESLIDRNPIELTPEQWAYQSLLNSWGLEYTEYHIDPCAYASEKGLYCFTSQGDVALLERLNRPAILQNNLPNGEVSYLFVEKVERGEVHVSDQSGEYKVSWGEIKQSWQGKYSLLWKPVSDKKLIRPGMQGEFVKAVDQQLAVIFNRAPQWRLPEKYNRKLVKEVKTFQTAQKISADGVIGPLTQIFMNNIVQSDTPKLR